MIIADNKIESVYANLNVDRRLFDKLTKGLITDRDYINELEILNNEEIEPEFAEFRVEGENFPRIIKISNGSRNPIMAWACRNRL